ncbi:MAG: hypothetical protein HHAS10_10990 [Candidatus Altimarinota bacterium]
MKTSLIHTERKLIAIFLGGAFLFLLLFEGFFLVSRFIFEEKMSRTGFTNEVTRIENHAPDSPRKSRDFGPKIGMSVFSIDRSGAVFQDRGIENPLVDIEEITGEFLNELEVGVVTKKDDLLIYKRIRPENPELYQVFIRRSGYPLEDLLRDILRFLILDILIIVPFYFMGRYFVRKTLEPVAENIDIMSHFIHDAGHELKTPLAIVSGNLQILRETKHIEKGLVEESIDTIHSMSDSLDGLLELSSTMSGEKIDKIHLLEAFNAEFEKEKTRIEEKKIVVNIHIEPKSSIDMDRKHFSLLFGNLIRNAITYNKSGGTIDINEKDGMISITDTGIGIDEKHIKNIWERFYRVERTGKNPGTGIGLSIVEKIIHHYGWEIRVTSKVNQGTTFNIKIK